MRSANKPQRTAKEARQQCRASVVRRDAFSLGDYRYTLERELSTGEGTLLVIMVNPSKADKVRDDHTITKLIEFCRRLGYRRLLVGNLCAYRATDVQELAYMRDAVGEYNHIYLRSMMIPCDRLVFAWGNIKKLPPELRVRATVVKRMAKEVKKRPYCWGTTRSGDPLHPLRLAYATKLRRFK